jgi:hypothetical protein
VKFLRTLCLLIFLPTKTSKKWVPVFFHPSKTQARALFFVNQPATIWEKAFIIYSSQFLWRAEGTLERSKWWWCPVDY